MGVYVSYVKHTLSFFVVIFLFCILLSLHCDIVRLRTITTGQFEAVSSNIIALNVERNVRV